jgi:hypothetical protein
MEANTVILGLPEYNALRDFKAEIEKGNTYRCFDYYNSVGWGQSSCPSISLYISPDEAVKEIAMKNDSLIKQITDLNEEINGLKNPSTSKEINIKDIKKMSVWEFLKWRKR